MRMRKPSEYDYRVLAMNSYNNACMHYVEGREESAWLHLLLWAEAKWEISRLEALPNRYRAVVRSMRQQEQQKLAGQLRLVTGMIGQARHLRFTGNGMVFCHLDRVQDDLAQVEKSLRHLLSNIKERIPA